MSVIAIISLVLVAIIFGPYLAAYFIFSRSELKRLQRQTLYAERRARDAMHRYDHLRLAAETASDGLVVQDMEGRILWSNPAYQHMFGYSESFLLGKHPASFAFGTGEQSNNLNDENSRFDPIDPKYSGLQMRRNIRKDGTEFWNEINVSFQMDSLRRQYAILVCRDATEMVEKEKRLTDLTAELEYQANHDPLTGVANRAAFMAFFEAAINDSDTPQVGVLHVDLDKFKAVNDTHGHSAGDAMLVHTAHALRDGVRATDLVARVGGDEFVVVCPGMTKESELLGRATELFTHLKEPFEWSHRLFETQASIGGVLSEPDCNDPNEILVQADFALYEAKGAGRNQIALYDDAMRDQRDELTFRTNELAVAIDTGSLDYHFQPKMSMATGEITGFETLVRWNHPDDGLIPPDQFLPMAEKLGLMAEIDLLSMSAALAQKRRLALAGYPDLRFSFNASPALLAHPEFVNRLVWGVEAGGIERGDITIEVLETTDFGEVTETSSYAAIIQDLKQAGFQVHLDDFGVGFAGLSHLGLLDMTGVKIDRGLVTGLLSNDVNRKIVRRVVELSNDLGLTVIAEGIEDEETAIALQNMGCDLIQGYWLSRPLPDEELLDWLAARTAIDVKHSA